MLKYLLPLFLISSVGAEVIRQNSGAATNLTGTINCANGSGVNIDGGTLYVDCTNNRVGIGNTSPVGALDVTGSGQFSSTLTVQGNAFSVGGSTFVVTEGRVGIGTPTPTSKLHMSSGTLLVDGTGADVQLPNGTINTGELADSAVDTAKIAADAVTTVKVINGAINTDKLGTDAVTSGKILDGAVATVDIANSAVDTAKIATDAVTSAKVLSLDSAKLTGTVPSGVLTNAVLKAGDTMTGQLTLLGSTLTVTGNAFSVGGSTLAVTQGRVGIGNTSPAVALDVTGSGQFSSTLTVQGNAFSVGGSTLVVTEGKIGIGTAGPSSNLDVRGTVLLSTSTNNDADAITVSATDVTFNADGIDRDFIVHGADINTLFVVDGGVNQTRIVGSANPGTAILQVSDSGLAEKFRIDGGGNVGIGDTSPDAKLEILAAVADTPTSFLLAVSSANDTTGNILAVRPDGNVGIGITSPATLLDIAGSAQFGNSATKSTFTATGDLNLASNADITLTGASAYFTSQASVTAGAFFGDGFGLTNISSSSIQDGTINTSKLATDAVTSDKVLSLDAAKLTGTVPSGVLTNAVLRAGDTMTGQLTLLGSTLTVTGNAFSVGGSTFVVTQGKVGIGASSPGSTLHVAGNTALAGATTVNGASLTVRQTATGEGLLLVGDWATLDLRDDGGLRMQIMATEDYGNLFTVSNKPLRIGANNSGAIELTQALTAMQINPDQSTQFGTGVYKSTFTAGGFLNMGQTLTTINGTNSIYLVDDSVRIGREVLYGTDNFLALRGYSGTALFSQETSATNPDLLTDSGQVVMAPGTAFASTFSASGLLYLNAGGTGGIRISSGPTTGTTISGHMSATASLDFGATAGQTCDGLTITVAGASDGDDVTIGVPNALASTDAFSQFSGFVSAAGTVTVKRCCISLAACTDPAAATVRASIWKH